MQLDDVVVAPERILVPRRADRRLLSGRARRRGPVAVGGKHLARGREVLRSHEQIEVSKRPQREVAVAQDGQDGPLVRHRRDAVVGEEVEEPNQLAGQPEVAARIGLRAAAQRVAYRGGNGAVGDGANVVVQQREHPVRAGRVQQPSPVQAALCQLLDLLRGLRVQ